MSMSNHLNTIQTAFNALKPGIDDYVTSSIQVFPHGPDTTLMCIGEFLRRSSGVFKTAGNNDDANRYDILSKTFYQHPNYDDRIAERFRYTDFDSLPKTIYQLSFNEAMRIEQLGAHIISCHLLDFLWESKHIWRKISGHTIERADKIGEHFIESCQKSFNILINQDQNTFDGPTIGQKVADYARRGIEVAKQLKNHAFMYNFGTVLISSLDKLPENATHWQSSLLLTLLSAHEDLVKNRYCKEVIPNSEWNTLQMAVEHIRNWSISNGMSWIADEAVDILFRITKLSGGSFSQQDVSKQKGENYIRIADKNTSGIARAHYMQGAIQHLSQAGDPITFNAAKQRIRKELEFAQKNGEFEQVGAEITISRETIKNTITNFLGDTISLDVAMAKLSNCFFVPNLDKPDRIGSHQSILSQIAVTMPIVDDRSLRPILPGTQEIEAFEEHKDLVMGVSFYANVLFPSLFDTLKTSCGLSTTSLISFIMKSPYITTDDQDFLKKGFDSFFQDDFITALHLLVPRLEQMIRRLLFNKDVDITTAKDGAIKEKPLGELLRSAESSGKIDTRLCEYAKAILSEEWGFNLRNRIAHGLITTSECTFSNCSRVIHCFVMFAQV